MKTSIKLCGFKNIDDIIFATSLDINYLGMIFVENLPRSIDIDTKDDFEYVEYLLKKNGKN